MRNIMITGATGFLGSYILKRLLDDQDIMPIVLARSKGNESATDRVAKTLKYFYGDNAYKLFMKRIKIVEGEIDKKSLGLDIKTKNWLMNEVDEIYHSAAIAEFRVPLERIREVNVGGTEKIMEFAVQCKEKGRLKNVNHISTTFLIGIKKCIFYEEQLDIGQKFNNTYEQSKYEAEALVHEYMKKLNITIFRSSLLTGDSMSGKTSNFKMLYQPLHFFAKGLFESVPANDNAQVNIIPVDVAAEMIYLISREKNVFGKTYHICNYTTTEVGHFFDVASDFFGCKKPEFVPMEEFDMDTLSTVQRFLIEPFIPYFNYNAVFDCSNTKAVLNKNGFDCPQIDDNLMLKLFQFCSDSGFIKRNKIHVT